MNRFQKILFSTKRCAPRISLLKRWLCSVENTADLKTTTSTIPLGVYGQPTCHTHPHLIDQGYLTCGITQEEYKLRRETLVEELTRGSNNAFKTHIIVIPAAARQFMTEKIPYVFRQNSDFFYLTGCLEPSAVLVMLKPVQTQNFTSTLFIHDKDSYAEMWEGPRTGCANAPKLFGVEEARPIESFAVYLHRMASKRPAILWYHNELPANCEVHNIVQTVLRAEERLEQADPQRAIHFMRVKKSPAEIKLMRDVCEIGSQSINTAMACTRPGMSEHVVNAILEYTCRQAGADYQAFPAVVAGGARATHIHYIANNQLLSDGEMLLVDSGSQRWLYNSDISRTWPVSGKFTKHHKILYELVLSVQKRLIEMVGQQRPPLDVLFDRMCRLLGAELQREGILPKKIDGNELVTRAYQLCPHHVSHYLGLDIHDSALVRRHAPVQPNMVITVEPGIYIRPDDKSIPAEFRGLGIRIEDDVLITEEGQEVLTDSCFKEVEELEDTIGKRWP